MTNPPPPIPPSTPPTEPGSDLAAPASAPVAPASAPTAPAPNPAAPASALDAGTFDHVLESRSPRRLPLGDGTWHRLARAFVAVELISDAIFLALVVAAGAVAALVWQQTWAWIPAGVIAAATIWMMAITPRQARARGYQLRDDDMLYRSGILWQRMVAVPYGRMQLVDISHGPLDRSFGIAKLKLVTAAASTGVTINGLSQAAAEELRDTLIAVAESRRTGL